MTSIYTPLDSSKREIRLLKFEVDHDSGKIHGSLRIVSLADTPPPRFTALSYVWGDPNVTEDILFNDDQPLGVTTNLTYALRHVRKHWQTWQVVHQPRNDGGGTNDIPRLRAVLSALDMNSNRSNDESFEIWADAICINQADVQERNQQVQLMAEIFQSAELVIAWLGVDDRLGNLALESFNMIASEVIDNLHQPADPEENLEWMREHGCGWLEKLPLLCEGGWSPSDPKDAYLRLMFGNERWYAMYMLFELEYWKRVWIFQETVLARELVVSVCTKTGSIHWERLERVVTAIKSITAGIQFEPSACPSILAGTSIWGFLSWITWPVVARISSSRKKTEWDVAFDGCQLEATDPKDHVYALLSLSRLHLVPDYSTSKSVGDVYRDFVSAIIKLYNSGPQPSFPSPSPSVYAGRLYESGAPPEDPSTKSVLFFLQFAGIGVYGDKKDQDFSSWAPNFPQHSKGSGRREGAIISKADNRVFPDTTPVGFISGPILVVSGVIVHTITKNHHTPSITSLNDGRLFAVMQHLIAQHKGANNEGLPPSVTEMPIMQRILRTINLSWGTWEGSTEWLKEYYTISALRLFEVILVWVRPDNPRGVLAALGLATSEPTIEKQNEQEGAILSTKLDGSLNRSVDADDPNLEFFIQSFLPGYSPSDKVKTAWKKSFISQLAEGNTKAEILSLAQLLSSGPELTSNNIALLASLLKSWHIFEFTTADDRDPGGATPTSFGIGPPGMETGDIVCVLHGLGHPCVLRRRGEEEFSFVGTCFVIGLMNGEAGEMVRSGRRRVEVIKLV